MQRFSLLRYFNAVSSKVQGTVKVRKFIKVRNSKFQIQPASFFATQACNRPIAGLSAGQKSKLTLASAMWTKPHLIALDEPTNYIDQETLDALTKAIQLFKGLGST